MAPRPPKPDDQPSNPRSKTKSPNGAIAKAIQNARKLMDGGSIYANFDQEKFLSEIVSLDDRSQAIVRGANLEYALETALSAVLTLREGDRYQIFRSEGPLGTFSNKIIMAYALNIFGAKTRQNLDLIRHIRNVFAHSRKITAFKTDEVSKLCFLLEMPLIGDGSANPFKDVLNIDPKAQYLAVCITLETCLYGWSNKRLRIQLGKEPTTIDESYSIYSETLP